VLSIAIALNEPLRPPIRKAVLRTIQAASHDLVAEVASKPDSFPAYTMSDTIGTISVCRGLATNPRHSPRHVVAPSFPKKEYDFDIFMRSDKTPRSKISGIDIDPHAGIGLSHCAIWFDDATRLENSLEKDLSAPLERLGRKIEQKLVQARSRTGDGRLLIVESWIAAQLPRASEQQIARLRGKIVDAHSNVSALLLVLRGWRPSQSRYAYEIHSLVSESANPAIRAMLQALEG
jgi:hypothetical protein